jgi:hypothetical protein
MDHSLTHAAVRSSDVRDEIATKILLTCDSCSARGTAAELGGLPLPIA